jgi:hypothetical protein
VGASDDDHNRQPSYSDEPGKATKFCGGLFLSNPGQYNGQEMNAIFQKFAVNITISIESAINTCLGPVFSVVGYAYEGLMILSSKLSGREAAMILSGLSPLPLRIHQGIGTHVR